MTPQDQRRYIDEWLKERSPSYEAAIKRIRKMEKEQRVIREEVFRKRYGDLMVLPAMSDRQKRARGVK